MSDTPKKFFKSKTAVCVLVVSIIVVLLLLFFSGKTSPCGCQLERIQYAKHPVKREGIKYVSPALQAMFNKKGKEGIHYAKKAPMMEAFNIMKTKTVPKSIATKTKEGFTGDYVPEISFQAISNSTPQSPFFGKINL